MTTANPPQHARISALARGWRAFRRWRRTRPFWGGLFLLLAGLEIFQSTQASLGGLTFQMGPTGFLSWLIPTILGACGLLIWFTPQQRMFYAIIGALTAVYSLIGVNLGGFFIGMLLGMIGGALGFAWTPVAPAQMAAPEDPAEPEDDSAAPPYEDSTVDELIAGPLTDTFPQPRNPLRESVGPVDSGAEPAVHRDTEHAGSDRVRDLPEAPTVWNNQAGPGLPQPRRSPPAFVITLIMLGVSVIGAVTLQGQAARADPCPSPAKPTGSASTSAPASSAAPTPASATPTAAAAAPGDSGATPTAAAEQTPLGATETPAPIPAPETPTPGPVATSTAPATGPGDCSTAQPTASPTSEPAGPVKRIAAAADQPRVNKVPSHLSGSKLTMYGLKLDGIVDLPTANGTLRTLKFSMSKAVVADFKLQIPGKPRTSMLVKSSALTVNGDVAFYATRFAGRVGAIDVTLTPDSPVPPDGVDLTTPIVVFEDPDIQLAFVDSNRLTAPDMHESFV